MGPNLPGRHYNLNCQNCGYQFAADCDQVDERDELVCDNCGHSIEKSELTSRDASKVSIDVSQPSLDRWDVVAFKIPAGQEADAVEQAGIKRIVGLAGETVELSDGNIIVDGQLVRKSIAQQKATRIHVYDSMYRGRESNHWKPISDKWLLDQSFMFLPNKSDPGEPPVSGDAIGWLGFQHQRHYSHQRKSTNEASDLPHPVEDNYGFNQSLSRDLNPMDEIFVSIDATISASSVIAWKFDYRGSVFTFEVDASTRQLFVTSTDAAMPAERISLNPNEFVEPDLLIEFSSIDQRMLVLINGNEYFQRELSGSSLSVSKQLLDFGASGGELAINRIRIWRDLYYSPQGSGGVDGRFSFPPADGLILLGDNVPISVDSRSWTDPRVTESNVIGKVISR